MAGTIVNNTGYDRGYNEAKELRRGDQVKYFDESNKVIWLGTYISGACEKTTCKALLLKNGTTPKLILVPSGFVFKIIN